MDVLCLQRRNQKTLCTKMYASYVWSDIPYFIRAAGFSSIIVDFWCSFNVACRHYTCMLPLVQVSIFQKHHKNSVTPCNLTKKIFWCLMLYGFWASLSKKVILFTFTLHIGEKVFTNEQQKYNYRIHSNLC